MKKLLVFTFIVLLFSCGKDSAEIEAEITGTWTLSSVSGTCLSLPTEGSGNEIGCIDLIGLEVNCSIIEINLGGTLSYAYNLVKGDGTYTIDGDKITICTDRCLEYILDGNNLTLQTGTTELCDPLYTFSKSTTSLDELVTSNQRKFIKTITKNGIVVKNYFYNSDGSLQSVQDFNDDGSLLLNDVYIFTPLTVTINRTYPQWGTKKRYEYYNEAIDRTRRDRYDEFGQLEEYRLYFHGGNDCWINRMELYKENTLEILTNYTYAGENCDLSYSSFNTGELTATYTSQSDGKRYYGESTLLNIMQYKNISNRTSVSYTLNGELKTHLSYNSVFTYDESNFPTSEIRTRLDGEIDILTYVYQ